MNADWARMLKASSTAEEIAASIGHGVDEVEYTLGWMEREGWVRKIGNRYVISPTGSMLLEAWEKEPDA